MGHVFSPILCNIDLEYSFDHACRHREEWPDIGHPLPRCPLHNLIAFTVHVDDSAAFSRTLCDTCLFGFIQQLWPQDVSTTWEGSGPAFDFLHTSVRVLDSWCPKRGYLDITPRMDNTLFTRGSMAFPAVSRMAVFVCSDMQRFGDLQMVFWSILALWRRLFSDDVFACSHTLVDNLADFISEAMLLRWPLEWVIRAVRSFPKHHVGKFPNFVRAVGAQLNTHRGVFAELYDIYANMPAHDVPFRDAIIACTRHIRL